jgi:hypothetical protein
MQQHINRAFLQQPAVDFMEPFRIKHLPSAALYGCRTAYFIKDTGRRVTAPDCKQTAGAHAAYTAVSFDQQRFSAVASGADRSRDSGRAGSDDDNII